MNKILKLTLILFLICAITAGVLGGVNELTKDRIYAINNAATIAAYSAVLEAESYDEVEFDSAAFPTVQASPYSPSVTTLSVTSVMP